MRRRAGENGGRADERDEGGRAGVGGAAALAVGRGVRGMVHRAMRVAGVDARAGDGVGGVGVLEQGKRRCSQQRQLTAEPRGGDPRESLTEEAHDRDCITGGSNSRALQ